MVLKDKQVVITGAGGGIGSQIALAFARKGANLALVDRNTERLAGVASSCRAEGVKVKTISADITTAEGRTRIINETESALGPVDVLVNNAGIMVFKSVLEHTEEDILNTLMVNVFAVIRLTQAVLPRMIERSSGRIVNIGSVFGSLSFPYFSIYSASKSAIKGFSEGLRRELDGTGVGVTYIAPRGTRTSQSATFFEMAKKMGMNLDDPEKVGAIVARSVEKEANEVFIGMPERLFVLMNKLMPSAVDKGLRKQTKILAEYSLKC